MVCFSTLLVWSYTVTTADRTALTTKEIEMTEVMMPKRVLEFVDAHRGPHSRAAFIVKCLVAIMNLHASGIKIELQ